MENWPRVTYIRWDSPVKASSSGKAAATAGGTSVHWHWQGQGRQSHTSSSFIPRIRGSTASTTATGAVVLGRRWLSGPHPAWEEKILAFPSLPNRMTRLSNTASPVTSTGRTVPTKASAEMR